MSNVFWLTQKWNWYAIWMQQNQSTQFPFLVLKQEERNNLLGIMCFHLDWNWSWNLCVSPTHTIQLQIVAYNDLFLFVDCKWIHARLKSLVITMKSAKKSKTMDRNLKRERERGVSSMHSREMYDEYSFFFEKIAGNIHSLKFDYCFWCFWFVFPLFQFLNYCTQEWIAKHKNFKKWTKNRWNK